MENKPISIKIDDVEYVRADSVKLATETDGMRYCIIRCKDAGVHAGWVKERAGREVVLVNSRRLWRWWGKTLSGLAMEGTFRPSDCKFAAEIPEIRLLDACEIIPCTQKAIDSLRGVAPWKND